MCPDPQLISIYLDNELPSPWKEKLESHLAECSSCREKLDGFKQLFNKNNLAEEQKMMEETKDIVWQKLQARQKLSVRRPVRSYNMLQRKLSIPIPIAAAAAILLIFGTAVLFRSGNTNTNGIVYLPAPVETAVDRNLLTIAAEESMPNIIPSSDLNSILQYLGGDRTEIIIINLPESSSFFRAGEPAIIRSADFAKEQDDGR